jgi:hypothetical protein
VSGTLPLSGEHDVVSKGLEDDQTLNTVSAAPSADVLLPLSPHWSVQGGAGYSYTRTVEGETAHVASSAGDTRAVTYLGLARYYAVHRPWVSVDTSQNPDRWPSAALFVQGNFSVDQDNATSLNGVANRRTDLSSRNVTVGTDWRIPLSNRFTLLGTLEGDFGRSETPQTTTAGTVSQTTTLTAVAGYRYYFVGNNAIADDRGTNPDRWTSLSLMWSGTLGVAGQETNTLNNAVDQRSISSGSTGLSAEFRLPVTNALTLRFGAGGVYSEASRPETAQRSRSYQSSSHATLLLGLRYYFI